MTTAFLSLADLLWAVFLAILAAALGRRALRRVGFRGASFPAELALAGGLGWGVLSYTVFVVGTLGGAYSWVIYGLVTGLFLILWRDFFGLASDVRRFLLRAWCSIRRDRVLQLIAAVLAVHVLLLTVGSLAPPSAGDATRYHLNAPKAYVEQHRVEFVPHAEWNYPFTAEMLHMVGLLVRGDVLSSAINNMLALWVLLSAYALSRQFLSRRMSLLAALIFFSLPWTTVMAVDVKSDTAYTLFGVLAILAIVR